MLLSKRRKKLARTQPEISARLWRAQGMRILKRKKSKYYREALSDFENAKRCYERAGLNSVWLDLVRDIRSEHFRKQGFMAEFEVLVAGKKSGSQPSFLERAKARDGAPDNPKMSKCLGWRGGIVSKTVRGDHSMRPWLENLVPASCPIGFPALDRENRCTLSGKCGGQKDGKRVKIAAEE